MQTYTDNNDVRMSEYPQYQNGDRVRIHDIDFGHGDSTCGYAIGDEGVIEDTDVENSHMMGVYFVKFDGDTEITCVCVEDMEKV
jgi:hypothetical protein